MEFTLLTALELQRIGQFECRDQTSSRGVLPGFRPSYPVQGSGNGLTGHAFRAAAGGSQMLLHRQRTGNLRRAPMWIMS